MSTTTILTAREKKKQKTLAAAAAKQQKTRAAAAAKKQKTRAATAALPARWARQAATHKAATIPLAGRDVDPRDVIATLLHSVGAQQLTADKAADMLAVLDWKTPRERVLALIGDAVDRMYLLADLDAGNVDVRQVSPLPAWYPENDHGNALRDVALQDLAGFVALLARRDNQLRRGDYVLRDEAQRSGNDLDAAVIGQHLGQIGIVCHCPDDVLAKHPTLGRFTALMPNQERGTWRSWDTIDDLRAWTRAYNVHLHGDPTEPGQSADLHLPASLDDLAPLTYGGLVTDQ